MNLDRGNPAIFKIENLIPSSFFGRGIPFFIGREKDTENKPDSELGVTNERSWPDGYGLNLYSALGTKFYLPIGFKLDGELIQLPWEPSLTITGSKTIVETPLVGNTRRGKVKELINVDDFMLFIQGVCYDHEHRNYPFEQVEIIKRLCEYEGSIEIVSALTNLFEIKNVVIRQHSIPGEKGKPFSQPFTIDLISDEDFILIHD